MKNITYAFIAFLVLALLADCLILAYLALILVGNMGVPLTLISGVALAWYVRRVYRKITR